MVTLQDALAAAVGHHQAGRLAEARPLYLSILRAAPGNADALHLLGVLESQSGRPRVAIPLLRGAVALLPDDPDFAGNLALALRAAGESDGAARALTRALTLAPDQPEAAYNLGNLLLARGDAAGAVQRYRQALARRGDFPQAWTNLGNALLALGRAEDAAAALAHAIARHPQDIDARINRAGALAALGDADGAGRLFRQAVALAPARADALYNAAANALVAAGVDDSLSYGRRLDPARVLRAVRGLGHALIADPGHDAAATALADAAVALVQAGQAAPEVLNRAARAAAPLLRRDPRRVTAAAALAYRFYRRGRTDLASRLMRRVLRHFPAEEIAGAFELRLWSMVRAERGFIDRLPPVEQVVSGFAPLEIIAEPPPGGGPLLVVSCDDGYCRRFAEPLLASLEVAIGEAASGGAMGATAIHLHIVNPSPDTLAALAAWRRRLPLGISRERADLSGWDDHRRVTYYACIRFLRWHQILERWGRPLIHLDADCTVAADPAGLAALLDDADVGLLRDPRWRGPTRDVTVCFAAFLPTAAGRAFLARTAAYIGDHLCRGRGYWMLDQAAPFCVLDALTRRGDPPRVRWFDFLDFPWVRFIGKK